MINRIPTRQQWRTVLDKLYGVLPFSLQAGSELNMNTFSVNRNHECGTVRCVGGWYAIAHWQDAAFEKKKSLDFMNGATQMAIDLGFDDEPSLSVWAHKNPNLWGNSFGGALFFSTYAYNFATDLAGVIRHLEQVADNCEKEKS